MKTQVMGLRFVFVFQCVDGVFRIGLKNGILRSQNKWKQICRYMFVFCHLDLFVSSLESIEGSNMQRTHKAPQLGPPASPEGLCR